MDLPHYLKAALDLSLLGTRFFLSLGDSKYMYIGFKSASVDVNIVPEIVKTARLHILYNNNR
jgi:hypothetical protein